MPGWTLTITDDGETLVVKPRGELDLSTAPELAQAFARCSDGHRAILCDLSEVEFMDSTGLRVMITARQDEPDRFRIARPSEPVERLLELTGTTDFFRRIEGM
jgi:anti-sigma B factor antagonist